MSHQRVVARTAIAEPKAPTAVGSGDLLSFLVIIQADLTNAAAALAHRIIPVPKHPTGLAGPALDIKG